MIIHFANKFTGINYFFARFDAFWCAGVARAVADARATHAALAEEGDFRVESRVA